MEEDLKILKVIYLSNHWLDFPQISNLSLGDQTKIKNTQNKDDLQRKTTSNGTRPENIKTWIYQQPLVGFSSNFKLKLRGPNQNKSAWKEDDHRWKKTSKYWKLNISATIGRIFLKF